jgi:hypothetical protein
MAQLINRNEKVVAPFFKNGVTLQFFTITFTGADLTAKLTTDYAAFVAGTKTEETAKSPVVKALELIQSRVSIEIIGTPRYSSSDTTLTIGVAAIGGDYPTDNYDGVSGNETMAAYLTTLVQCGKTYQGFAMSSAAVAADVRGVAL